MSLDKQYQPSEFEAAAYQKSLDKKAFSPNMESNKPAYCIMLPPPNVTGVLHMGHAFQQTLMDILVRYQRMLGKKTLFQPGTDHASIATQLVVEKQLAQKGIDKRDLGRSAFLDKVWEWKEQSGNTIVSQMKRLGVSLDWDRNRFTLDKDLSLAVQKVFIDLYEAGLIYRGQRLVNWDPVLQTAISDLEVIAEETQGQLFYIHYPTEGGRPGVVVATTRPETLFGDMAIAVNPTDERYQHLIGKTVCLPLTTRRIPVIADEMVDANFGTGAVKVTPAHDFNDYAMGQRHHLALLNIFSKSLVLNEAVPSAYQGLAREQARKQVVSDLSAAGFLQKTEPHLLKLPRGEKSGAVIEPLLTDQWFVKASVLAKPAIEAVEQGRIRFVPETWSKTYFEWMNHIQDWCISRQLWWGHRIPAWYDDKGKVYVGETEEAVRQKYSIPSNTILKQDEDVLDTWFSSALWPFSTLGWPEKTDFLETFYPTQVLITGFDIIFFWVARMIMFALYFTKQVPFETVYIHGLVQDADGQKMSKSKGNVIDPIDLIDGIDIESLVTKRTQGLMQPSMADKIAKQTRAQFEQGIPAFGTDALRFTFASLASHNRFIRFDLKRIEGYKHFCNKLWNATRYVLMKTVESDTLEHKQGYFEPPTQRHFIDQWIILKWDETLKRVQEALANYRFDFAAQALYDFVWNTYCDWYIELSKPILSEAQSEALFSASDRYSTAYTLLHILESVLRALHPFMPFMTEVIWQSLAPHCIKGVSAEDTIMLQAYPESDSLSLQKQGILPSVIDEMAFLQQWIEAVRQLRSQLQLSPKRTLSLKLKGTKQDQTCLQSKAVFCQTLLNLDKMTWVSESPIEPSVHAVVGNLITYLPLDGLVDVDKEKARLSQEIKKQAMAIQSIVDKLNNPRYLEKAPRPVVEKERARLVAYEQSMATLKACLSQFEVNLN